MSSFGKLNWGDLGKGILLAFLTAVIGSLTAVLEAGDLPTLGQLQGWALTGLAAAGAYLLKNIFTNSKNELAKKEN